MSRVKAIETDPVLARLRRRGSIFYI